MKDLLEDVNPQLLNTISSEFDKVEGTPAPVPTRTSADLQSMTSDSGGGKGAAAGGGDPLDDLFPRVELDGLLKGTTILADAKSDAWKTKKEALEGLQAILDQGSNKRLKPSMGMFFVYLCPPILTDHMYRRNWAGLEGQGYRHEQGSSGSCFGYRCPYRHWHGQTVRQAFTSLCLARCNSPVRSKSPHS